MSLTLKEKEYWRDRITQRIDEAVDEAIAGKNPNYMWQIGRRARERVWESMGIAELAREVEVIDAKCDELDRLRRSAYQRMLASMQGVSVEEIQDACLSRVKPYEVEQAINAALPLAENEVLSEDELGRRILELRGRKERLVDVVWAATSPREIKQAWSVLVAELDQQRTPRHKKE